MKYFKHYFFSLFFVVIFTSGYSQPNGTIEVYNVVTEGVDFDDSYPVIQNILDNIKDDMGSLGGGGIVYLPPGTYKINNTLRIPPRTVFMGMGGSYNLTGDGYGSDFMKHQSVVLKWTGEEGLNMIEPYPDVPKNANTLESVIIQGIALDGDSTAKHGIYLPSIPEPNKGCDTRSGLIIREVLIAFMKESGFMSDVNQAEFRLEKVCSYRNKGCGFKFIDGDDLNLTGVWAGGNEKDGFYFESFDNVRSFNCDAFGNSENGLYIESSGGLNFHKFQSNDNFKNGAVIFNSIECTFIGASFTGSSRDNDGVHSEIYIKDSYGIKVIGSRIGNKYKPAKPKWGIYDPDLSSKEFSNIIVGSTFYESVYQNALFSDGVLNNYVIEGCTNGSGTKYNDPYDLVSTSLSPYHIKQGNKTIIVDTDNGWKQLKLPDAAKVPIGKEYLIIKQRGDNMKILITPAAGDFINNSSSDYEYMNSYSNTSFRIMKISNGNWIAIN